MRSIGKVTAFSVSITVLPAAGLSCCAHALKLKTAHERSNHPVFFMLPPNFHPWPRPCGNTPNSLAQRGLPPKVTLRSEGGQGYEGVGQALPFGKILGGKKKEI